MIKRKRSLLYVLSVFGDISLYAQHGIIVCFFFRVWCVVITTVVLLLMSSTFT